MLFHHGSRPYEIQAGEAADKARDYMERMIEAGRVSGRDIIEKVMTEVPKDTVVKSRALTFGVDDARGLNVTHPGVRPDLDMPVDYGIHDWALTQMCDRYKMPIKFARYLQARERQPWGDETIASNLTELAKHDDRKFLLRSIDGRVRGFLSDRYKRLDSRPLIEAFAGAAAEIGAVPVQGYGTDTKVALKALLPRIYEPAPNEVMAFGVMWENSDYANGVHALRAFCLRLWCTNYAIADEALRQVHLGKRLSENIRFSDTTYALDTKTTASAIRDIVKGSLGEERTTAFCSAIKSAHEEKIDVKDAIAAFRKDVSKGELEAITETFNSPEVENLPPGNTAWRLSNAISWIAGQDEHKDRKLDLEKIAGSVLALAA